VQEDLAIGIGDAAVDGVAAHDRDHVGILPGLVLPDDLAFMGEIERVDRIGERSVDIHGVADHQRTALMAAQHAGREGPGHLQLFDVGGVDLVELGITRVGVIALLHHPLLRVLRQLLQRFIRTRCRYLHRNNAYTRSE
jgi:hypothetical protein